jgi:hypothetical protein
MADNRTPHYAGLEAGLVSRAGASIVGCLTGTCPSIRVWRALSLRRPQIQASWTVCAAPDRVRCIGPAVSCRVITSLGSLMRKGGVPTHELVRLAQVVLGPVGRHLHHGWRG